MFVLISVKKNKSKEYKFIKNKKNNNKKNLKTRKVSQRLLKMTQK